MKCCLPWYLDKVVISYSEVWDIISGSLLASSQNTPEHVLIQLTACTQQTDQGEFAPMLFQFYLPPPPSLEIWREWEGKEIIVLSVLVANCTFWVRQYSWSWKHSYSCVTRCKTSPMLCFAANKPHWGNSQTEKKLQDCLLLDLSYRGCVLSSQQHFFFFLERERPIFGLSFDIMYTFLLPDEPLWFAVCVLPLAMWLNGLLSSSAASPPPSTHKYIDYVSHKVHSADEDH